MTRATFLPTIATALMITGGTILFGATQNYLSKYSTGGALVDSTVYESGGSVGIGTASPARQLHVYGSGARLRVEESASGNPFVELYKAGAAEGFLGVPASGVLQLTNSGGTGTGINVGDNDNVGIGTGAPQTTLHVLGNGARIRLEETATANPYVEFRKGGNAEGYLGIPASGVIELTNSGASGSGVTVNDADRVGIGTAIPLAKLHVAGDVKVDGNIAAKYQDLAEWVPSHQRLEPGTVVVLSNRHNGVEESSAEYDDAVAGVISPNPGVILGEAGVDKTLVAHSGRVKVKADATQGAIQRGDLLVTSSTPGYAMKSKPLTIGKTSLHRPGTILGKAIEPLASGRGEILMLLTLQ